MIFDDLLKDLEKGANSRVLAEKLFESFQHTEIQPILKEIQKKILEKNDFLKKILANNYVELLNCSQLLRGLTVHSSKIKEISLENQRVFSSFETSFKEKSGALFESQEKRTQKRNYEENLDIIIKKVLKFQQKRLFFFAGGLIRKTERILTGFEENNDFYQVFNMVSDLKRENLSRISSFFNDFLRGTEKNCSKDQFFQSFWGLFLSFFDMKSDIENCLMRSLKLIENLIETLCKEPNLCYENIIKFLFLLMETFEDSSFEKNLKIAENLTIIDLDILLHLKRNTILKESEEIYQYPENLKARITEEFYRIAAGSLVKLRKRLDIELSKNDAIPIAGFNFSFLKSIYFSPDVRKSYQELLRNLPNYQEIDFYQTIKSIWLGFFNGFLEKLDLNIKTPVLLRLLKKTGDSLEKDELKKYRKKSESEILSNLMQTAFENLMKTLGFFENLIQESRNIPEFHEEINLERELNQAFSCKIKKEFIGIREEILKKEEEKGQIGCLRNFMVIVGFLKKLEDRVQEFEGIKNNWKKEIFSEVQREIQEIHVVLERKIQEYLDSEDNFVENGLNLAKFPQKIDFFFKKINRIISEIEKEQNSQLFDSEFYMKINAKVLSTFNQNSEDMKELFVKYFALENDENFAYKEELPEPSFTKYSKFLRKNVQEMMLQKKGGFSLKNLGKTSQNPNFPLIDQNINNETLNLTLIPMFKPIKLSSNPQKKGNQIQQSQSIVSSIANKDEDYLSRVMEGLNNTMKGLGIKEKANVLASSYNSLFSKK